MSPRRALFQVLVLTCFASLAFSQSGGTSRKIDPAFSSLEQQSIRSSPKVDPALLQARLFQQQFPSRRFAAVEHYLPGENLPLAAGGVVGVLIKGKGDVRQLVHNLNGTVGSQHGDIFTAFIRLNVVEQLAENDFVEYVEASRVLYYDLDLSVAKTGADILHAQVDPSLQLTGKGVIVGFTDSGIDFHHPSLKRPSGRTRILRVWDQSQQLIEPHDNVGGNLLLWAPSVFSCLATQ